MRVDRDWDPLRVCVVGRTYDAGFYDWIHLPHLREIFAEIATRTGEFLDHLSQTLERLGVEVVRPNMPAQVSPLASGNWPIPPLQPRNVMTMIHDRFYYCDPDWSRFYQDVRDAAWHDYATVTEFLTNAPQHQRDELYDRFDLAREMPRLDFFQRCYAPVLDRVAKSGTPIHNLPWVDGGQVCRVGEWLVVGTDDQGQAYEPWQQHFGHDRVRVVDTRGHVDGVFCVLKTGLVVAHDDPGCPVDYRRLFPDWEVILIKNQNLLQAKRQQAHMAEFIRHNQGHWWIPDIEHDPQAAEFVQQKFRHWTGNASETILDVNMLVVDDQHVLMCGQNTELAELLDRHGMTPIVMPVPYPYFWDGGIHCMTAELHRERAT